MTPLLLVSLLGSRHFDLQPTIQNTDTTSGVFINGNINENENFR